MLKIINFSIQHRFIIMVSVICLMVLGVYNFQKLPIDAVPDITNVQVQINTEATGYSPLEVEQRITFPIETALSGIPKMDHTRSLSSMENMTQKRVISYKILAIFYKLRELVKLCYS